MTTDDKEKNPFVIIYIKNQWGHCMPIEFSACCQVMTIHYDPSRTHIYEGYRLDNTTGKFILITGGGKQVITLDHCPWCDAEIRTEEREIKNFTEVDPPCAFKGCGRQGPTEWSVTVSGFKMTIACCDLHDGPAGKLAERLNHS